MGALACTLALGVAACQSGGASKATVSPTRAPDRALVTATLASAAERSGDLAAAQQYYAKIIEDGDGTAQIYERRGEILLTLGAPGEAAQVFAGALSAGFDTLGIRRGYGRALWALSRPDAALEQYDAALAKNPSDSRAMNGRGVVLDTLGRHEEAQAQYRGAMTMAPSDLAIQNNLAMSYALSGRAAEAIDILERIQASGRSNVQQRQNLALLYGLLGKMDKAQAVASQDLPAEDVARNMAAYASLQLLYDGSRSLPSESTVPPPVPAAPPAEAPSPPPVQAGAPRASGASAAPVPAAAATSPAAARDSAEAGTAASAPSASRPVPVQQPWVVDLGVFDADAGARDAWQKLKASGQPAFVQVVHYMEPEGNGRRLLAGPFWSEEAARTACAAARDLGMTCEPHQASAVRANSANSSPGSDTP
jgi:Flp pilus assembly protein TadD